MRVLIAGAGPGGLTTAFLLKDRLGRACDVLVLERVAEEDARGWGVTLHPDVLQFRGQNPYCYVRGARTVRGRDQIHTSDGHVLATIGRPELTRLLLICARERGVEVAFDRDGATVPDAQLASYDLVVAADGHASQLRQRFAEAFAPSEEAHVCKYIWLGAAGVALDTLLTMLSEDPALPAVAWAYRHSATHSTVVAEMLETDWSSAGFDRMPVEESVRRLETMFGEALEGRRLLTQASLGWTTFRFIKSLRSTHRNVALVGDALSTKHFSLGLGTFAALADAEALVDALTRTRSVAEALHRYEETYDARTSEHAAMSARRAGRYVELLQAMTTAPAEAIRERVARGWLHEV